MKKVGVLCIQGLPARHGAFEQTVESLVGYAEEHMPDIAFYVGCSRKFSAAPYDRRNVVRLFARRFGGIGILAYGILHFTRMYAQGIRTFLVFGYTLSPFFGLMASMKCNIICNVDGFEWRRAKWNGLAKGYFRFCERMAALSPATLIFDSIAIARYYSIIHRRTGEIIFYGTEKHSVTSDPPGNGYYVVVMRLEPENHILEIVQGFLLSSVSQQLMLIGPSTRFFENNVLPLIEGSGRIKWLGPIYDRERLYAMRKHALAYVHGHSVGGTNPTLVEACEIGRPVIAFDSIFNREVLGSSARYFKDAGSLARCLEDPPVPCPTLDERYTWKHVCERYLSLLDFN